MPYFTLSDKTTPPLRIFYLDQGPRTAQPVLLVHGVTCDIADWSWQVPLLLSLGYRVISSDHRGHGKSSIVPATLPHPSTWPGPDALDSAASNGSPIVDYYPQTIAVDQIKLLDHLGIKPPQQVIVIGHSLGTTISYFLSTTYLERVKALVTIDPYHNQPSSARDQLKGAFDTNGGETLVSWFTQFAYLGMKEAGHPPPEWYTTWHSRRTLSTEDPIITALALGGWEADDSLGRMEVARECYMPLKNGSADGEGGRECRIKCPFLAVGMTEENLVMEREMLALKGNELDEVVLLEGHGHWPHQLLGAEKFNKILEGWLGKVGLLPAAN